VKKRTKIILWIILLPLALVLGVGLYGYYTMRTTQAQMFEEPVIDTLVPELPAGIESDAVLVYSKTSGGFRHSWSIDAANEMILLYTLTFMQRSLGTYRS